MRKRDYISPSGISLWLKDPEAFYMKYLADAKPPNDPQTKPMSVGSAFDAYVKAYLHKAVIADKDPKYEFEALFEAQVEPHNRDWARKAGFHCYIEYKDCGALQDLLVELTHASQQPRFEFDVTGLVKLTETSTGVVLLGKPDLHYANAESNMVTRDWKVNGYCGKNTTSPAKGYTILRESGKPSKRHKDLVLASHKGMKINVALRLEDVNPDWARQISIYSWLCGAEIGEDFIACIDQLACSNNGTEMPNIRVAEHKTIVGKAFQLATYKQAEDLWDRCNSDWFFREVSKEESARKQTMIEDAAKLLYDLNRSTDPDDEELRLALQYCKSTNNWS